MAIRVIEAPLSVRFDPPPRPSLEDRRRTDDPDEEAHRPLRLGRRRRRALRANRRMAGAGVECRRGPRLTLTSLPSQEYLRGVLDALRQFRSKGSRGPRSELEKRIVRALECLKEAGQERRTHASCRRTALKGSPETTADNFRSPEDP